MWGLIRIKLKIEEIAVKIEEKEELKFDTDIWRSRKYKTF